MANFDMEAPRATILRPRRPCVLASTARFMIPHSHMRYWSMPPSLYTESSGRSKTESNLTKCEVVTCAMPGVVTNSRSRPSSLKKPLSRATSTGGSAAIPAGSLLNRERILEPGVGKIVGDHLRHRLEQLELIALFRNPEHDNGLQRRTSGKAAGDLRDGDRRLFRELEALSRPRLHALDRLETSRSLLGHTQHRISLA